MITVTRPGYTTDHVSLATRSTATSRAGIDFIAVERAANGELPDGITRAEKQRAAGILFDRGFGPSEIGRRLHVDPQTAMRWRDAAKSRRGKGGRTARKGTS